MSRVLVFGGRGFGEFAQSDASRLSYLSSREVDQVMGERRLMLDTLEMWRVGVGDIVVHGAATGADRRGAEAAVALGARTEPHPADWQRCAPECPRGHRKRNAGGSWYCPTAGFRRNQAMVDSGLHLAIEFPGGRGTADMHARLMAAGVEIVVVPPWEDVRPQR